MTNKSENRHFFVFRLGEFPLKQRLEVGSKFRALSPVHQVGQLIRISGAVEQQPRPVKGAVFNGEKIKIRIAGRLREETVVTVKWIAERLKMGTAGYVNNRLHRWRKGILR